MSHHLPSRLPVCLLLFLVGSCSKNSGGSSRPDIGIGKVSDPIVELTTASIDTKPECVQTVDVLASLPALAQMQMSAVLLPGHGAPGTGSGYPPTFFSTRPLDTKAFFFQVPDVPAGDYSLYVDLGGALGRVRLKVVEVTVPADPRQYLRDLTQELRAVSTGIRAEIQVGGALYDSRDRVNLSLAGIDPLIARIDQLASSGDLAEVTASARFASANGFLDILRSLNRDTPAEALYLAMSTMSAGTVMMSAGILALYLQPVAGTIAIATGVALWWAGEVMWKRSIELLYAAKEKSLTMELSQQDGEISVLSDVATPFSCSVIKQNLWAGSAVSPHPVMRDLHGGITRVLSRLTSQIRKYLDSKLQLPSTPTEKRVPLEHRVLTFGESSNALVAFSSAPGISSEIMLTFSHASKGTLRTSVPVTLREEGFADVKFLLEADVLPELDLYSYVEGNLDWKAVGYPSKKNGTLLLNQRTANYLQVAGAWVNGAEANANAHVSATGSASQGAMSARVTLRAGANMSNNTFPSRSIQGSCVANQLKLVVVSRTAATHVPIDLNLHGEVTQALPYPGSQLTGKIAILGKSLEINASKTGVTNGQYRLYLDLAAGRNLFPIDASLLVSATSRPYSGNGNLWLYVTHNSTMK